MKSKGHPFRHQVELNKLKQDHFQSLYDPF